MHIFLQTTQQFKVEFQNISTSPHVMYFCYFAHRVYADLVCVCVCVCVLKLHGFVKQLRASHSHTLR